MALSQLPPLPPQLIKDAKRLKSDAVAQLLESQYTRVHRLACGLSGRDDVGHSIARFVFRRCLRVLPSWDPASQPEHWFHRFTVQMARRNKYHPPTNKDLLFEQANPADPPYQAFIAALRGLPVQQQEAYLLHYGERFDLRDVSRAMDCSTQAASTHLMAATDSLRLIAGQQLEPLTQRLYEAYQRLTPDEALVLPSVATFVRRHVWPRRVFRAVVKVIQLAIIVGFLWIIWKLCHIVRI